MTHAKLEQIANMLVGLPHYEWSRIRVAVDKTYSSASAKLEISDAETVLRKLKLEFNGFID